MMARRHSHSQPALYPYRENGAIRYAPAPGTSYNIPVSIDDDFEPLISLSTSMLNEEDESDALMRFTATGRPMPPFTPSPLVNLSLYSAPQFLPQRYTDDSVIPVVVQLPDPAAEQNGRRRSRSILDKIKGVKSTGITKVVFMPRRDYLKYFAKDYDGSYIGTEPQRQWTEEELEEHFGRYKKDLRPKRSQRSQSLTVGLNA